MGKLLELAREYQSLLYYRYIYLNILDKIVKKMKEEFPIKGSKREILEWYKKWLE
jgi:intein-encoded DNA endonuclease-like protein